MKTYEAMLLVDPTVAGLASVHGCIGAVDPVRTFGTPQQKEALLPRLASGEMISGFALTEPGAGSDLTALRTTAVPAGDAFEVTGEKLFITNAIPGRTIGLVVMLEGKPAVLIADLPQEENDQFQMVRYGLYALRNTYNNGLRFNRFRIPRANLLKPTTADGLTIADRMQRLPRHLPLACGQGHAADVVQLWRVDCPEVCVWVSVRAEEHINRLTDHERQSLRAAELAVPGAWAARDTVLRAARNDRIEITCINSRGVSLIPVPSPECVRLAAAFWDRAEITDTYSGWAGSGV